MVERIAVIVAIAVLAEMHSSPIARADAAADTAKAQAMLAEQAAALKAEQEVEKRTRERVERAIMSAPYVGQYLRECRERNKRISMKVHCDERLIRSSMHAHRPFKPVYEALFQEFWAEEIRRYAAEQ